MTAVADAGPVAVALVGAGEFGTTFLAQARRVPNMHIRAICDRDPARLSAALKAGGYGEDEAETCATRSAALSAIESGRIAKVEDQSLISDLPLDIVVEATGDPEAAAAVAWQALGDGYHSAMVTKEAEIVVGPALAARARAAGLVHTPVDGDQPSLLISLIERAGMMGLPVVAAGKSTESDYVYNPESGTVGCWGREVAAPGYRDLMELNGSLRERISDRVIPTLETATVPDLCEMGVVANHSGLRPDRADLHSPVARTLELPDLFCPSRDGGILEASGVVDVFVCLRLPHEISFAGGVFVIVETPDPATGRLLAAKGIPVSQNGRYLLMHNPVHLLGLEAIASVLAAVRHGRSSGGNDVRQRYDLVARAERDFHAGEVLGLGPRHAVPETRPLLVPARVLGPDAPVPYYLAANARVRRPARKGTVFTLADLDVDPGTALMRIRQEQDAIGAPAVSPRTAQ